MRRMGDPSMFFGLIHGLFTLALLAGLVILIVMIVKKKRGWQPPAGFFPGPHLHHQPPMGDALRILDERLARGEIEIDDYVARKTALLGDRAPGMDYRGPGEPPSAKTPPPEAGNPSDHQI